MGMCSRTTTIFVPCNIHKLHLPTYPYIVVYNYALVGGALEAYGSRFVCVFVYVCNMFIGDRYKLGTGEYNAGTTWQYLKSNSLKFLI